MSEEALQLDDYTEPAPAPPKIACSNCYRAIISNYYTVNGGEVCAPCHGALRAHFDGPMPWRSWLRVLVLGGGAALIGTAIYFTVLEVTGYELGLIAIVVGLLVGGAVKKAAGGRGGWKLQVAAMALTYSSIVASYVPTIFRELVAQQHQEAGAAAEPNDAPPSEDTFLGRHPGVAVVALGGVLFGLAVAAPWLAGAQNFMGWIIIGIALYEAWKLNHRPPLQLAGPFQAGATLAR
jgi:hypothetical protein